MLGCKKIKYRIQAWNRACLLSALLGLSNCSPTSAGARRVLHEPNTWIGKINNDGVVPTLYGDITSIHNQIRATNPDFKAAGFVTGSPPLLTEICPSTMRRPAVAIILRQEIVQTSSISPAASKMPEGRAQSVATDALASDARTPLACTCVPVFRRTSPATAQRSQSISTALLGAAEMVEQKVDCRVNCSRPTHSTLS